MKKRTSLFNQFIFCHDFFDQLALRKVILDPVEVAQVCFIFFNFYITAGVQMFRAT